MSILYAGIGGGLSGNYVPQYDSMPTASVDLLDKIVQYKGATDANYTNGYFYKCIALGTTPETYSWSRINVQPSGSGGSVSWGGITGTLSNQTDLNTALTGKQPLLTAGNNIQINGSTISATDTTYTAGTGINITNGVISNTQTSAEWGNITGTLSSQTDLQAALDAKQVALTAGTNITINGSTISATDTTYTAGAGIDITSGVISNTIQVTTMPTASASYLDKTVQYTGATDSTYTNSYFYKCVSDGQTPATYSWSQINVQPGSSGGGTWGSITGTLSDQTDLQAALDAKQATLVSGTNIKTINNNSIVGSGNLSVDGLPSQTGQSGKILTTNGTDASWTDKTTVTFKQW